MKKSLVFCAALAFAMSGLGSAACAQESGEAAEQPAVDQEKASYGFGYQMGSNMHQQEVSIDLEAMIAGLRAGMSGEDPKYTEEEMQAALQAMQQAMMAQQQAKAAVEAEANMKAGQEFLAENAQREGVETLPSGLQVEVIEEGEGASPTAADRVKVHYKGTLVDGTVFDSSYDRGQPATFGVGQVIPGFSEGLQRMKPGAEYKLYIPADIAYGAQGRPGLPPNSTLIFEVELLEVVPATAPAAGGDPEAGGEGAES